MCRGFRTRWAGLHQLLLGSSFFIVFHGLSVQGTDAPTPLGAGASLVCKERACDAEDSGREWCYLDPQLLKGPKVPWGYCAPVVDYDALRRSKS